MIWSISGSQAFKKCQRQWYFKNHVASATAHDPFRREAYLLSKHQSIAAWRGNIVDQVISTRVIPALNRNQPLYAVALIRQARTLFDEQFEFAQRRRVREPGMTQVKAGTAFAALHPIEYQIEISDENLAQAWNDIETSLTNFLQMDELLGVFRQATNLLAQRALCFSYNSTSIRSVPDLIAFFPDEPPLIVDWKVHTYAMQNYRLQLTSYALALTQCKPHKDFPVSLQRYDPTDIRLLEAQLLTKSQRQYSLTETDVEALHSFIARTAREMSLAVEMDAAESLTPFDFPTTLDPEECQRCPFRSLCWEQ